MAEFVVATLLMFTDGNQAASRPSNHQDVTLYSVAQHGIDSHEDDALLRSGVCGFSHSFLLCFASLIFLSLDLAKSRDYQYIMEADRYEVLEKIGMV